MAQTTLDLTGLNNKTGLAPDQYGFAGGVTQNADGSYTVSSSGNSDLTTNRLTAGAVQAGDSVALSVVPLSPGNIPPGFTSSGPEFKVAAHQPAGSVPTAAVNGGASGASLLVLG